MTSLSKAKSAHIVGNLSQHSPCGIFVNPGHVPTGVNKN